MTIHYIEAVGVEAIEHIEFIVELYDTVNYGLGEEDIKDFCIGKLLYIKRAADSDWTATPETSIAIDPDDMVSRFELKKNNRTQFPDGLERGRCLTVYGEEEE